MNKVRVIILMAAVVSLAAGYIILPDKKIDESIYLDEIAPDVTFPDKSGTPPHYFSKNGVVAFNSYDIVPSITGYAGPIKLLIAMDAGGRITGIKILEHRETKNYINYMISPAYMGQFLGKNVNDPFEVNNDIDAISRATVSVEAMAKTVRESSREVASQIYSIEVEGEIDTRPLEMGWIVYLLFFFASLTCYFITRKSKKFLRLRDISLLLGIIIIGFYLSTPFSVLHVFNLILLRLPASLLPYVILLTTFVSIAVAGRFYCGWLCPFGALAEFFGRIPLRRWKISDETDRRWRNNKYVLLFLIFSVVLFSRRIEYGNYETYVTLFSLYGNLFTWTLVVLMLIINIRVERFWCRFLCPVAALTGLLSVKAGGYISRNDCPMANPNYPHISECIRCNKCYTKERAKETGVVS